MITAKNIVVIGSSTGGPRVLEQIFSDLPILDAAVVVVQHMPVFANPLLRDRLNKATEMEVTIPDRGERLRHGEVFLAPSGVHMELRNNKRIGFSEGPKVNYVRPSIDVAMESLKGRDLDVLMGAVLTGMGQDGAAGLAHIKGLGGITMAQEEESCAIFSMPKAAIGTGKVDHVLTPLEIREKLIAELASD